MLKIDNLKTVTDLRTKTVSVLKKLENQDEPIYIQNRSKVQAVMLSVAQYNRILAMLEDYEDAQTLDKLVTKTKKEDMVPWDDFKKEFLT